MFNPNRQLLVDTKTQDKLREWFSKRDGTNNVVLSCISLGDSDIDYELSDQVSQIRVLNAPYNVHKIKHKLIFSGGDSNVSGRISVFRRYITAAGDVQGTYNFPPSSNLTTSVIPPTLANGEDVESLTFSDSILEGYVLFLQTLPDNFLDPNGVQQRIEESYTISFTNLPLVGITNIGRTTLNLAPVQTLATIIDPVIITTSTSHGLVTGDKITIAGASGNAAVNGIRYVSVLSSTTFKIYTDVTLGNPVLGNGTLVTGGTVERTDLLVTTALPHNYTSGEEVILQNTTGITGLNGVPRSILVVDSNNFVLNNTPLPSTYGGSGEATQFEIIIDSANNSLMFSHVEKFISTGNTDGVINIKGNLTGITKPIKFNY